jgi:DNA repair exonuclease SbcCD nuclease subunit
MPTLKFLHYTDVHIQENNPPSRLGDYKSDVFGKMRQIMALARTHKVDFTVCGGDLFNAKKPAATKHSTVTSIAGILNKVDVPHYLVPGNHDLTGDSMDTIPDQPIGVLLETGVMKQITNQVVTKKDLKVQMFSFPFDEEPDLSEYASNPEEGVDVSILGIHVYASPRGGTLYGKTKVFSYPELSKTKHDVYLLGHYHADNGAITDDFGEAKPQTFVNVGSVTRGDYGDENLARVPKVCLVTITKNSEGVVTVTTEEIELKVRSNAETFDLERKSKLKEQKQQTEEFVTQLLETSEAVDVKETISEQLAVLATEKEIFDLTMDFITRAHEELGKVMKK